MKFKRSNGFALPSILIVSAVMFAVLVVAVSSVATIRASLAASYYNQIAKDASEAGAAYARDCLAENNGVAKWSDANPLKPSTDCSGQQLSGVTCPGGATCYVVSNDNIRSTFSVGTPKKDSYGKAVSLNIQGTVNLVRSSSQLITWRTYTYNTNISILSQGIVTDGLVLNVDAGNANSYDGTTYWGNLTGAGDSVNLVNGVGYSSNNGGAMVLDGSNDYMTYSTNASIYTYEIWVNPASAQAVSNPTYFNRGAQISTSGYIWAYTEEASTYTILQYTNGSIQMPQWIGVISYDTWNHLVFVLNTDSNTLTLYRNGVNAGTYPVSGEFPAAGTLYISAYQNATGSYCLKGKVSSINLYNRPLSDAEVRQNFNALRNRYGL